jgi:hypothetical protein
VCHHHMFSCSSQAAALPVTHQHTPDPLLLHHAAVRLMFRRPPAATPGVVVCCRPTVDTLYSCRNCTRLMVMAVSRRAATYRPPCIVGPTIPAWIADPMGFGQATADTAMAAAASQQGLVALCVRHPQPALGAEPPHPPVRALLPRCSTSSAAIPDQAPGSGPLRRLLDIQHPLSLDRAAQEGGRVPAGTHTSAAM